MTTHDVTVDQYATPNPQGVERRTPVPKIAEIMRKGGFRHVPVVEAGLVVGIISDRDVRMLANVTGLDSVTAAEAMTKNPYLVDSGTALMKVASDMAYRRVGSAVVVKDGAPTAIFTATDALRALIEILAAESSKAHVAKGLGSRGSDRSAEPTPCPS